MKRYVLIAGVNGAGKSTLYQTIDSLKKMERVNTDEIVRRLGNWDSIKNQVEAGRIAVKKIRNFFEQGISFNQETTLCGRSIKKNIEIAKSLGYFIELHYVGVDTVEIAKSRIAYRVENGGHGIPDADVERRYIESLKNLPDVLEQCDFAVLYDNTVQFRRFAVYENGKLSIEMGTRPKWFS